MSNYFTLRNQAILNPPTGTDLGSGDNKFANVYIGNQLTVGTTTVDSSSIGSIKIAGVHTLVTTLPQIQWVDKH